MPIDATNYARAALGQGLGMGWGDEAEAWLRSRLPGGGTYEQELAKIQKDYGSFAQKNPVSSAAAEFAGGTLPMVASYLLPGGQAAAPATTANTAGALARLAANPLVRGAAVGLGTGAISGAGSAQPGNRIPGAVTGGVVGTVVGGGAPVVIRGGKAGYNWLRDRLLPTEETVTSRAAGKINRALDESGMTPKDAGDAVKADRARGVPSTVANTNPALVDLAETVAQRSGPSARRVEDKLRKQTTGARERVYAQTRKAIDSGEYYADEARLLQELRDKSGPAYQQAYAVGEVNDPQVMKLLELPQFRQAWETARAIAETDAAAAKAAAIRAGQDFDETAYKLRDIYSVKYDKNGMPVDVEITGTVPDVRTLDYMKRALDAKITAGYRSDNAATVASATSMKQLRDALRDRTKEVVPEYANALQTYKGDREVIDALQAGMNDFNKLDHEEVIQLVSKMTPTEKEAFRTGVVRHIYGTVMNPSSNMNPARKVIGSPEMVAKLQPLFDSPQKFNLFQSVLEREKQLYDQANRVLGGAATGRRLQARERFEEGPGVGAVIADAATGGFGSSLTNLFARVVRSGTMTDDVADKVAQLLMSSEPNEVAAAVKVLESYGNKAAKSASNLSKAETGAIMGTVISSQPAPPGDQGDTGELEGGNVPGPTIERSRMPGGPDIEEDIKNEK